MSGVAFKFLFALSSAKQGRNITYFHLLWKPLVWNRLFLCFSVVLFFSGKQTRPCLFRCSGHFDDEANPRVGDALAQGLSAENTNPLHWALPTASWLLFPCSLKFLPISLRKGWNPRWWPSKGLGVRKRCENTAFWKGNCWSFNICEHANFPKFHNLFRARRNRRWESTVTFTVELFSCPFYWAGGGILVLALFEWVPLKAHLCWLYLVEPALHDWATH